MNSRQYRRRVVNGVALTTAVITMILGLTCLVAILLTLLRNGLPALNLQLFTRDTPPPGDEGGLRNAVVGSLFMTIFATVVGTPIGILAGTYLAEIRRTGKMATAIRTGVGLLAASPSVIIGFFVYTVVVGPSGHFSAWAGIVALAFIQIPIVTQVTESRLRLIPNALREAAAALGAPAWRITLFVTGPAARAGILTGVLLGVARIGGESAPLLFTALNNQFFSLAPARPMANLPVTIYQFAMSPYDDWQALAWAGALLITLGVLSLNMIARIFLRASDPGA